MTRRRAGRFATAAAVLALTSSVVAAAAGYLMAPVGELRASHVYIPAGSATPREAGLAAANVGLDEVPEHLLIGLLHSEDKNFFEHHGFDFAEIGASIRQWIRDGRPLRGASTLTQQLARSIFLTRERTFMRKIREAIDTVKLERYFTKDEILLLYLNNVEWGRGVYGIAAAAAHYFEKPPAELDARQCAFLVAILPSPIRLAAAFTRHRATPLRMQRVLTVLQRAAAAHVGGGGEPDDALVRLLPSVRKARERASGRRATS